MGSENDFNLIVAAMRRKSLYHNTKKHRVSDVFYKKKYKMEQVKGIEPSQQAWEACVLPLNYTCDTVHPSLLFLPNVAITLPTPPKQPCGTY